jgi:hypothetical protein
MPKTSAISGPTGSPENSHGLLARWGIILAGSVIVLATWAAYANSFSTPFLFDDLKAITQNPTIRHLWPLSGVLSPPNNVTGAVGRPVVNLSLAVNYALGGFKVNGYHVFNAVIHALAGLALFGIVRRTLLRPVLQERFGAAALPLALAVALLWALHPLLTESVTGVVQRNDSMISAHPVWFHPRGGIAGATTVADFHGDRLPRGHGDEGSDGLGAGAGVAV